jgi:excisionase family DNA binding protein
MEPQVTASHLGAERLLTPAETAALLKIDPKTLRRRVSKGKLTPVFTLGGQRRYRAAEVVALLDGGTNGDAS